MTIAMAIYGLTAIGLCALISLVSMGMLKTVDWLKMGLRRKSRRKPLTLPELKAKWSNVEAMKH